MKRSEFNTYIKENNFKGLFITEMGWNQFRGYADIAPIEIENIKYKMTSIAERNGFQIIICPVTNIPNASLCKKIDYKLRHYAHDYICIFYVPGLEHHQWIAPIKTSEKRDLVSIEYETAEKADFLFSKINDLSFELGEVTTIVDVQEKVQGTFAVNSEKITKDFYTGFKKEHKIFTNFITGIDDEIEIKHNKNKQWYASVMLNRLMFCYFIQKKGFLDNDVNYLQNKLNWVKKEKGENRFFKSFYKGFLTQLFQDGLNTPGHDSKFEETYGRIPYLNGGMFDQHSIEQDYKDIDIEDEAFIRLFSFFDKWRWHLDTRITASGKDINPDVLGYIFEQYINDRAEMGAYYTKEDITEYIARNSIIPYLIDQVKNKIPEIFEEGGYFSQQIKNNATQYIFDSLKKGYFSNWKELIPKDVFIGLDITSPNLPFRRRRWGDKTDERFALNKEIWRETIDRFERCDLINNLISNGTIKDINDFIIYNLDIKSFVFDLLNNSENPHFISCVYSSLQTLTVLDPTCGSGAFLFAAMNILEPLYEICINRMQDFNVENHNLFEKELNDINSKCKNNIQYYIYKSIILQNLYGVDIMVEAVEIAKLRLFLKMVAVTDINYSAKNLGLDPLPDIDFNIRCGNTLVGYTSEENLEMDLKWGDPFINLEFKENVQQEISNVATVYQKFKEYQFNTGDDIKKFKVAKNELTIHLNNLNTLLNHRMHQMDHVHTYENWMKIQKPFHWIAEFYEIIKEKGGFDVIIGNPPYVEFPSEDVKYSLDHLISKSCGNLYGCCTERGFSIGKKDGRFSFIVPVAISCSKRMEPIIKMMKEYSRNLFFSNFDDRPGKLFEMIEHLRATIFMINRSPHKNNPQIFSTKYNRWYSENRNNLFNNLKYVEVSEFVNSFTIPKFSYEIEKSINRKLLDKKNILAETYGISNSKGSIYYRAAGGGYFLLIKNSKSITYINGILEDVKAEKEIKIDSKYNNTTIGALLSSSLFYWNYIAYTDCRNLTKKFIDNFRVNLQVFTDFDIINQGEKLFKDYEQNRVKKDTYYKTTGRNVIYYEYYPKKSKRLLDTIDTLLARYYNFTQEELDYIINFDIKYRIGENTEEE